MLPTFLIVYAKIVDFPDPSFRLLLFIHRSHWQRRSLAAPHDSLPSGFNIRQNLVARFPLIRTPAIVQRP